MPGTPPSPQGTRTNQAVIDGGTGWPNATPNPQQPGKDGGVTIKLNSGIRCTTVGGGALSAQTILGVNEASGQKIMNPHLCIAYEGEVKVGGSLAWRANNPGNLRDAPTKIGSVPGQTGKFAVFASMDDGRGAQRDLYLGKYGDMTVRAAVSGLTPPSENDTKQYLKDLKNAGVDLDKNVKSQIETLMKAIQVNEGLIAGVTVERTP